MLSQSDKVKDYEIIAPLGSGGMAVLYLARRRGVGGFSRLVTLKLVHQHLAEDENIVELFLHEARISAHVAHPNVVHVEEVGQCNGRYFIAMEYVHGVSLAALIARVRERRLRLRPKVCVWLAAQVAEALHAAHEARGEDGAALDIVHRDISPQNVLISHTGHVKLIDFGIANSQNESERSERGVLGKLKYMAPEQLRLERADRRSDVYALGVLLWEMLTGRSLLRCQRHDDERDWAIRENPPPPSQYSGHTMPELDRVVQKAIACAVDDRYESAFTLRAALLKADPAAVQLDAPTIAGLMRTLFGDELDKRRANWPSEIAGELEFSADPSRKRWTLDELTAENSDISVSSGVDALATPAAATPATGVPVPPPIAADAVSGDLVRRPITKSSLRTDEPTSAESPAALRATGALPAQPSAEEEADSLEAMERLGPRPLESVLASLSSMISPKRDTTSSYLRRIGLEEALETLKTWPVSAFRFEQSPLSPWATRALALGSASLAIGILLGSLFTPSLEPIGAPRTAARAVPAAYANPNEPHVPAAMAGRLESPVLTAIRVEEPAHTHVRKLPERSGHVEAELPRSKAGKHAALRRVVRLGKHSAKAAASGVKPVPVTRKPVLRTTRLAD